MYKKIIVPLDGSELAECVLPHVEAIAKGCGNPEVILVNVVQTPEKYWSYTYLDKKDRQQFMSEDAAQAMKETKAYLDKVAKSTSMSGLNVKTDVFVGEPTELIADYANKKEADLIVIATHGRSGVSRWTFGSVADRLLRSSCVPVLMVRAPGCVPGI